MLDAIVHAKDHAAQDTHQRVKKVKHLRQDMSLIWLGITFCRNCSKVDAQLSQGAFGFLASSSTGILQTNMSQATTSLLRG